jgi:hypothetical protein
MGGMIIGGGMGICPLSVKEICPPHIHMLRQLLVRAGMFSTNTSAFPGIHGVVIAGMQGAGVGTPMAAAVAEMTAGFMGDEHMPKDEILVPGAKSLIFSFGMFDKNTFREGFAINGHGAIPKEQVIIAPEVT